MKSETDNILIYRSEDGRTKIDVMLEAETLWLSQKQLTELLGRAKGTVSEHIKHIFDDGELDENSVVRFFRTTAADGKQYEVAYYNLVMALARTMVSEARQTAFPTAGHHAAVSVKRGKHE